MLRLSQMPPPSSLTRCALFLDTGRLKPPSANDYATAIIHDQTTRRAMEAEETFARAKKRRDRRPPGWKSRVQVTRDIASDGDIVTLLV